MDQDTRHSACRPDTGNDPAQVLVSSQVRGRAGSAYHKHRIFVNSQHAKQATASYQREDQT